MNTDPREKKKIRTSFALLMLLVILLILVIGLSRALFPYVDRYQSWFEQRVTEATGHVIHLGEMQASWKTLYPKLEFQNVIVFDETGEKDLIHIPQFEFNVDLLRTLLQRRLVPHSVTLSGIHLTVYQGDDALLEINGLQTGIGAGASEKKGLEGFFEWILEQGEMNLKNISIDLYTPDNAAVIPLTNLQLTLQRGFVHHQMRGRGTLAEKTPTTFEFVINLKSGFFNKKLISANASLCIENLMLAPWMKPYTTWGNLEVTEGFLEILLVQMEWEGEKPKNFQSQFQFGDLVVRDHTQNQPIAINNFSGNAQWREHPNGWAVSFSNFNINVQSEDWPLEDFAIRTVQSSEGHSVYSSAKLNSEQGWAFILQSPLNKIFGKQWKNVAISGPVKLDLNLFIPRDPKQSRFALQGHVELLSEGTFSLPHLDIYLTNLTGGLSFTENTVTADKLKANWLGSPLKIKIATDHISADERIIHIDIGSHFSLKKIAQAYALDALDKIATGETTGNVKLAFTTKQGITRTDMSFHTDLQGVTILPQPFAKQAAEKVPLNVQLFAVGGSGIFDITAHYAKVASAALQFIDTAQKSANKSVWVFDCGELHFGPEQPPTVSEYTGLGVTGYIPSITWSSDIAPWLAMFKDKPKKQNTLPINHIDLHIGTLNAFGLTLSPIGIKAAPHQDTWKVNINNKDIAGWAVLSTKQGKLSHIEAEFDRLNWIGNGETNERPDINPGELPSLNILLKDFCYENRHFGKLYFVATPQKNALRVNRMVISSPDFVMNSTGLWQMSSDGKTCSTLKGEFHVEDTGELLREWGVSESLVDGKGTASFLVSWPGPIYHPDLEDADGSFSLNLQDGRILHSETSNAEVFGRMLNFLSLESLPRLLMLDFSDLTAEGFGFDEAKGDFVLNDGIMRTKNTYIDGDIARLDVTGDIDIHDKQYDLIMLVTPSLTASLPVAATIIGGPAAGAIAWVAHKVLGGMIDSMTSRKYRITGPWSEPSMDRF